MDGWVGGWVGGWMSGWVDGWEEEKGGKWEEEVAEIKCRRSWVETGLLWSCGLFFVSFEVIQNLVEVSHQQIFAHCDGNKLFCTVAYQTEP